MDVETLGALRAIALKSLVEEEFAVHSCIGQADWLSSHQEAAERLLAQDVLI